MNHEFDTLDTLMLMKIMAYAAQPTTSHQCPLCTAPVPPCRPKWSHSYFVSGVQSQIPPRLSSIWGGIDPDDTTISYHDQRDPSCTKSTGVVVATLQCLGPQLDFACKRKKVSDFTCHVRVASALPLRPPYPTGEEARGT